TGTITFQLFADDGTGTGCGTKLGQVMSSVAADSSNAPNANGDDVSPTVHVSHAGLYHWIANYSGDANNQPTTNGCHGPNEDVTVGPKSPKVLTNAGGPYPVGDGGNDLTDTATLSGASSNAVGTITFQLYADDGTGTGCGSKMGEVTRSVPGDSSAAP